MPRGRPRDWTLDELQFIWSFDGSDGQTVTEAAESLGVANSHWYGIRSRLQNAGGPEPLFAVMEEAKKRRYQPTANGKVRTTPGHPLTLLDSVTRVYMIRAGAAGRGGAYQQYTVTIPPLLAAAFVEQYGWEVTFEPREDGILLKPIPRVPEPDLPSWLKETDPGSPASATPDAERPSPESASEAAS